MWNWFKSNALIHLARTLWRHAEGHRSWVALYVSMAILAMLVGLCGPLVLARLMNEVQSLSGEALEARAELLLIGYFGLGIVFWMLHGPSRVLEIVMAFRVRRALQKHLLRSVTGLPMKWHRQHHSGETIDQVSKASLALGEFTESGFEVIHLCTKFIGSVAILTWMMPFAAVAVVVMGSLAVLAIVLFDRHLVRQYTSLNKRFNEVAAAVQDYLTNIATVISLRLEKRVTSEVDERTARIMPLWRKNAVLNELKWFTTGRFVDVTHAGILLTYILAMVRSGQVIEIGTMYALSEYLRTIGDAFFQFTGKYGDLVVKSTRVHGIDHIEEAFNRDVRAAEAACLPHGWRSVAVGELSFRHGDADPAPPHISGMSITFERGKSYALVGESGSGKSTLLGLLRGIHSASSAQVWCDGVLLPHGMSHIAHHCTLIPQDPEIFADSVRFNITMGLEGDEATVRNALRLARFDSVLSRLARGLETGIAEKGVSLSGGEKQRLALARGLYFAEESDSEIILLDEPTSSVDIFNERLIYEGVLDHFRSRCVMSAVHKFHLLHLFDQLLVFSKGKLVEQGTLEDLLARRGELARLWESYYRGHEEEKVVA